MWAPGPSSGSPRKRPLSKRVLQAAGPLGGGDGVVDFAAVKQALDDIGADPYYASEVFNPSIVIERGSKGAAVAMKEAGERVT